MCGALDSSLFSRGFVFVCLLGVLKVNLIISALEPLHSPGDPQTPKTSLSSLEGVYTSSLHVGQVSKSGVQKSSFSMMTASRTKSCVNFIIFFKGFIFLDKGGREGDKPQSFASPPHPGPY